MVHWGCWGSIMRPDTQAGPSTIELVGYQMSHKEIQDIYQSLLLRKINQSTSTKVFSCYEDYQVFPVVGMTRERR